MEDDGAMGGSSEQPALYQCAQCTRRFVRMDHLARHIRTHTKEKPHRCSSCGKQFARADLLRRHAWRHVDPNQGDNGPVGPEPSLRASKACQACAVAKSRCNNDRPCQRCIKRGIRCVVDETPATRTSFPRITNKSTDYDESALPSPSDTQHSTSILDSTDHRTAIHTKSTAAPAPLLQGLQDYAAMNQTNFSDPFSNDGTMNMDMAGQQSQDPTSMVYADFLKDLLFTSPGADDYGNTRGICTPQLWNDEVDMSVHFADALAGVDFGDFTTMPDYTLFNFDMEDSSSQLEAQSKEDRALAAGTKAFTSSVWHWVPSPTDHSTAEQHSLAVQGDISHKVDESMKLSPEILARKLQSSDRDRVLAVLFEHCDRSHIIRIASSFPSHQLMERLLHTALHTGMIGTIQFLHIPTFDPQTARDELVACLVAYGAFVTPIPALQQLSSAMADMMFLVMSERFCSANANTRDFQFLACFAIYSHILFWSGNKRRTEIGESFCQPLITMLRRGNAFTRQRYQSIIPSWDDTLEQTDAKWRAWAQQESWIRLVHHVFASDAQVSMTVFTSPLISAAEMNLPMPASDRLWRANGREWRERFLALSTDGVGTSSLSDHIPRSLEAGILVSSANLHCTATSQSYTFFGIWHIIWTQQLLRSWASSSTTSAQPQNWLSPINPSALARLCDSVCFLAHDGQNTADMRQNLLLMLTNYSSLALYAPLKSLPVFAGKDGEQEARRVSYQVREWANSSRESRQALWHAGQVIRYARSVPRYLLQTFFAVAVYHASLTLWTVSMIASARVQRTGQSLDRHNAAQFLHVDGNPSAQRVNNFLALGEGTAAVSCIAHDGTLQHRSVLGYPGAAMRAGMDVFGRSENLPRFVESISKLMDDLAGAAESVGFG